MQLWKEDGGGLSHAQDAALTLTSSERVMCV